MSGVILSLYLARSPPKVRPSLKSGPLQVTGVVATATREAFIEAKTMPETDSTEKSL